MRERGWDVVTVDLDPQFGTARNLEAERHAHSIEHWTSGAVKGKPAEDGSVRVWSAEDARRLRDKGEIAIPPYPTPFRVGAHGSKVTGSRCPGCQQDKRVAKEGGPHPLFCFGCGVWSAENAQPKAGRVA